MRKLFYTTACIWLICLSYGLSQNVEWVKKIHVNTHILDISQIQVSGNGNLCIGQMYVSDTTMKIDENIFAPVMHNKTEFYLATLNSNGEILKIIQPLGKERRSIHDLAIDKYGNYVICGGASGRAIFDTIVLEQNSMFALKYNYEGKLLSSYNSRPYLQYSGAEIMSIDVNNFDNSTYFSGAFSRWLILDNNDTLKNDELFYGGGYLIKVENAIVSDSTGILFGANIHENFDYTFDTRYYKGVICYRYHHSYNRYHNYPSIT
jgi:hypothetical protein